MAGLVRDLCGVHSCGGVAGFRLDPAQVHGLAQVYANV